MPEPEGKEAPNKKGKEKKKVVIKKITPLSVQQKKDTFQRFEDGVNQLNQVFRRELKITAYGKDKSKKQVKIVPIKKEEEGCFCGNHYFNGDWLKGNNVVYVKTGSKIQPSKKKMDKEIKAIIQHRTAGWDISGAIGHSKGTHFYIEKPFRDRNNIDGEIYQPFSLDVATSHIKNETARIAKKGELLTENTIGIEVCGMGYTKGNDGNYYHISSEKNNLASENDRQPLTRGFKDPDHGIVYWDQLTKAQTKSTACLVKLLMEKYNLTLNDIYVHEEIQSKTAGEGTAVKEAIWSYLTGEKQF